MLLSLAVRDFVIVDQLALDFSPGFTVLTGETGAGKSILIDALQLALGERAEADVVREGAARAEVGAEFRVGAEAAAWLAANDLQVDGDTALMRRVVDAGGRSRAYINGSAVTLAQLRSLGDLLLDVHGQHAHQSLLRPAAQLALLDAHGGLAAEAHQVATAHAAWRQAARALDAAQAMQGSARAEQDRLRWIVEELAPVAPRAGEWAQVEAEHRRLAHGAGLLEGTQAAVELLADADGSALSRIDRAAEQLAKLSDFDARLQPAVEALAGARAQLDDAARFLNRYLDGIDLDQRRLAEVEARVAELHDAARKFRCAPEELAALLESSRGKLSALAAAADLDALRGRHGAARAAYDRAAGELGRRRSEAARNMAREVTRAMQDLSMAGGRYEVELTACEPSATGSERAEFLVAGHAGVAPKPLAKVASGGELARISLAIAVIAASATPVATLIFDEVDAGIGGAVAETVGRLLKQLGGERQVLCVTHLPQVAARGDQHLQVSKVPSTDGRPVCRIAQLDRKARVDEVARMLGG
ncbi:MAG: DNA repair protein RecN, partial [Burkholderiaceae bacterium]|nr:DNA repair protein RecN [Burkholderiaceae bacterium]